MTRVISRRRWLALYGTPAPFKVTLVGLSSDVLGTFGLIGDHAGISYTITPDLGTETVKWSNSPNPADAATFGTGASPTDFASAEGGFVYLHVTDDPVDVPDTGPKTRTVSFRARDLLDVVLTSAGPQVDGDIPLQYSTNLNVSGRVVVYYDDQPVPAAADFFNGSSVYVYQGSVNLTTAGGAINVDLVGTFNGSVRFAFLPNGGDDADVIISPTVTIDTTPVVPPNEWVISGTIIVSSPTVPVPVVSGTQIVG